jgi:hypothetical protein
LGHDIEHFLHPTLGPCGDFDGRQCVLPADYKQVITKKIGAQMEKRMAGQGVDKLIAILSFMNSEDHSQMMPSLIEYTKMLDISRDTDFFEIFPELAPY